MEMLPMNNDLMFGTGNDATGTPREFFDIIDAQVGGFGCDVAALATNRKVANYFGPDHEDLARRDCLTVAWPTDRPNWLNPPYSDPEHECKFQIDPTFVPTDCVHTRLDFSKCKKKLCEKRGFHNPWYRPGCVDFVRKAAAERELGAETWALLASRTDNGWFHDYLYDMATDDWRHGIKGKFLRGRLKFEGHKDSAPFPSLLVRFIPDRLM